MYTIAHLTDSHLDGGDGARSRFERVMAYLHDLPTPVDLLILTGDLIEGGAVAEYRTIAEAVAGDTPPSSVLVTAIRAILSARPCCQGTPPLMPPPVRRSTMPRPSTRSR